MSTDETKGEGTLSLEKEGKHQRSQIAFANKVKYFIWGNLIFGTLILAIYYLLFIYHDDPQFRHYTRPLMNFNPPISILLITTSIIYITITICVVRDRTLSSIDIASHVTENIYHISISILFLLLSLFEFAFLYMVNGLHDGNNSLVNDPASCLYFSVVTWTTLGYGDLHPSENSRFYAGLEAIYGYLYLSIFISSLFAILCYEPPKKDKEIT